MSDIRLDLSEVDKLEHDLRKAADNIDDDIDKELGRAAVKIHAHAVAAVPRATGELAGSIYLRSRQLEHTIGSDEPQGFYQEFGTSRHPPQPWLFPAVDRGLDDLTDRIVRIADPLD